MNRRLPSVVAIVAVMLLVLCDAAIARPDSVRLENGSQEQTAGIYFGSITIDVRSGPRGGNPRGDVVFLLSGLQIRAGAATCLAVRNRSATIGFVDGGSGQTPQVTTVQVRDGATDSFDAAFGVRGPNNCHRLRPTDERGPLTSGDLRVVDAGPRD